MNLHAPPPAVDAADIRAALERVLASAELRSSLQLIAFLRFVVETSLNGEAARIKASTIGTEALGRAPGFDSQRDPIVRVEAQRLRRALSAYYEGTGADEPIIIDIPRGGYVPVFRPRMAAFDPATAPPSRPRGRRMSRVLVPAAAMLVLVAVVAAAALYWHASPGPSDSGSDLRAEAPVILVEPIQATSEAAVSLASVLNRELTDALRRVQPVMVISVSTAPPSQTGGGAGPAMGPVYRMSGSVDALAGVPASITLRLVADGMIEWTRDWRIEDGERGLAAIAREAAVEVAASSGIMHSRLRVQSYQLSPGYRCLFAAASYMRKFELAQHERVRDCLERTVALDARFEIAFAVLAFVYEREYVHDLPSRIDELPPLERSLMAARQAIAINPNSVVGHLALMENLYLRGELVAAFAAGDKARSFNPLDPAISGLIGLRLLFSGETDRGAVLLKHAASQYGANPGWLDFGLFCLAYVKGDMATAARHADLDVNSTFPFGLASRAIVAAAAGDRERARRMVDRLTALYPGWSDPKRMLAKFIHSPQLVDRLAGDLAAISRP